MDRSVIRELTEHLENATDRFRGGEIERRGAANLLNALFDELDLDLEACEDTLAIFSPCTPSRRTRLTGRTAAVQRSREEDDDLYYASLLEELREAGRLPEPVPATRYIPLPQPQPQPQYTPNWMAVPQPQPQPAQPRRDWMSAPAVQEQPASLRRRVIYERVTERLIFEEVVVSGAVLEGDHLMLSAGEGSYQRTADGYLWRDNNGRQQLFPRDEWALVMPEQCQMLPMLLRYVAGTLLVRRSALEAGRA